MSVDNLKLKSMTREEYFDVIDLMRRYYSMLDIYKTKKSLDLADWVKQTFYLCNMAVKVKNVIDVDWQSMEMSLSDMFKLHRFSKKLNDDILSELSDVIPGMKDYTLPVREVKWHYGDEDDEDYDEDDDSGYYEDYHDDGNGFATRAAVLNLEVDGLNEMDFISDNEKTIVKEARDTANKILAEYQKMLEGLSPIVERAYNELKKFHDSISAIDSKISEYLTDRYYTFLEAKEAEIEDSLVKRLYEKYVDRLDETLEPRHWTVMLKDYLNADDYNPAKMLIKDCFSYSHALDISDPRINSHLCNDYNDLDEIDRFFNYFLEVAILQSKVRSDIRIIRRPLKPLPSEVVAEIRDNPELNGLFRDALGRVVEKVKARNTWKWGHLKKVLEDDRFIIHCNDSVFGRLIHDIFPDINDDQVRRNVGNSSLSQKDLNKHYRDISETNALRSVLIAIGDEFKELRNAMQ